MPRSLPLFLFPALLSGLLGATLAGARAWAFRPYSAAELGAILASSPHEGERVAAMEGLALARDARGLDVLLDRAGDPSADVRKRAIMVLSLLDSPAVRQRIERAAAEDPDPSVQALARSLLSR